MTQETATTSSTSIYSIEETDEIKKYRFFWWKTGNIHPKARWEEATENRFVKLEQKQTQVITNEQEVSPIKNISPPIEDQSDKNNGITLFPMSKHNSTQIQRSKSKSLTDPGSSITSLP
ncbi:16360_t:CDS:2 [Acaulospora morrowiae]|uniref:16360_t:CDS:1 n=1 Tax=Acaulospora morrowiae TaxID=94023 RepID=A0A9N9BVN0_9GLOM|nr:16360_t:CDS:2 [Acaulospora morrowiae]